MCRFGGQAGGKWWNISVSWSWGCPILYRRMCVIKINSIIHYNPTCTTCISSLTFGVFGVHIGISVGDKGTNLCVGKLEPQSLVVLNCWSLLHFRWIENWTELNRTELNWTVNCFKDNFGSRKSNFFDQFNVFSRQFQISHIEIHFRDFVFGLSSPGEIAQRNPQNHFFTFSSPQNVIFTCFSTNNSQFSPIPVHSNSSHMRAQFKKFSSVQ